MDSEINQYHQSQQACTPTRETLRRRLEYRIKSAQENLKNMEEALKFLNDNPSLEVFHDLINKIGF